MKKFCENPFCENEGIREVRVSVNRAADGKRTLCAACEEVFAWGVQHGRISAEAESLEPAKGRRQSSRRKGPPTPQ